MSSETDTPSRLAATQDQLNQTVREAGREAQDVRLLAVSKTQPATSILPALEAGHRDFGENRVQEAEEKWPALKDAYPDVSLHLIGPLQRNKVKRAVQLFDVIETVDRLKLARALAREMKDADRWPACFVQVNTGEEEQKAGIAPQDTDAFIATCRDELHLPVAGLMCIPPVDEEPALHFALLREIAERNRIEELSMGMSADYETAIRFGATEIRVGTAIFGPRQPPPLSAD